MTSRRFTSLAFAFVVSIGVLGAGASRVAAGDGGGVPGNRLTFLTFSRSVSLPGVTLPAGTYAFEVANPDSGADVVLVRDHARRRTYFLGITHRSPRPFNWSETRQVVFGETARGEAAPIRAWYPVDNAMGHEFIYPR